MWKDAVDLIAVNPTEHKRATITQFLLIEGEFWMQPYQCLSTFWPALSFIQLGNEIKCYLTPFKYLCTPITSVLAIRI